MFSRRDGHPPLPGEEAEAGARGPHLEPLGAGARCQQHPTGLHVPHRSPPRPAHARGPARHIPRPAPTPWPGPAERCWATPGAACGAGWERGCVSSLCCVCVLSVASREPRARGSARTRGRRRAGGKLGGTEWGQSPAPCPYLEQGPAPPRPAPCPVPPRPMGAPAAAAGLRAQPAARHPRDRHCPEPRTRSSQHRSHRPCAGRAPEGAGPPIPSRGSWPDADWPRCAVRPGRGGATVGAGAMAAAAAELQRVVDVEIDDGGVFKYVLLRVRPRAAGASEPGKEVVRGHGWAEYHGEGRAGRGGGGGRGAVPAERLRGSLWQRAPGLGAPSLPYHRSSGAPRDGAAGITAGSFPPPLPAPSRGRLTPRCALPQPISTTERRPSWSRRASTASAWAAAASPTRAGRRRSTSTGTRW